MEAPDVGTMPTQAKHWTSAWLWDGRVTRDFRPNLFQSIGYVPHHCTLDFFPAMRSFLSLASHDMFKLSHDKLYFLGIQGVLYHQMREGPMSLFVGILT